MAVTVKEINRKNTKRVGELAVGDVFKLNNTLFVATSYEDDEAVCKAMILDSNRFGELIPFFRDEDEDIIVEIAKDIEINVRY